jgi:hypothetical protein
MVTIWQAGTSHHMTICIIYIMLARSGCVEQMYNWHTEMEEHTNVSVIHLMCHFITLCVADPIWGSDCQGFWNLHRLWVGYRQVQVWVHISVSATYKTSPRTSKTDKNWWTYGQNSRKYCLAHISVISGPFWLFLGSKTHRVRVRVGKKP